MDKNYDMRKELYSKDSTSPFMKKYYDLDLKIKKTKYKLRDLNFKLNHHSITEDEKNLYELLRSQIKVLLIQRKTCLWMRKLYTRHKLNITEDLYYDIIKEIF